MRKGRIKNDTLTGLSNALALASDHGAENLSLGCLILAVVLKIQAAKACALTVVLRRWLARVR